uniref:Uncharacterized protein n=1 Tax=viral metagenome TaxID=1070528 RepID=A0A6C0CB87_9ZZZZ
MEQYLHIRNLVNANLRKSLFIELNRPIFAYSKSRQCKFQQSPCHRIQWTNIDTFKVLSMQILTSL